MKTIVFDLGGVLIDWNPRNMYRKYLSDKEIDFLLSEVCNMDWNALMDAGLPFQEGTDMLAKKFPEHREMIIKYWKEWPDMIGGPINETVAILEKLHAQNYPLYALTNWSMETFPPILNRYDFFKIFKGIVVSAEEGICKPDEKIYQILFERYNINPSETIFIDDNMANIVAAKRLGMTALHYQGADQLIEDLTMALPAFRI